jgi:hypothetical protein
MDKHPLAFVHRRRKTEEPTLRTKAGARERLLCKLGKRLLAQGGSRLRARGERLWGGWQTLSREYISIWCERAVA